MKRKIKIDWPYVEKAMLEGFRGQTLTPEQQEAVRDAFEHAPEAYAMRSRLVRAREAADIRRRGF